MVILHLRKVTLFSSEEAAASPLAALADAIASVARAGGVWARRGNHVLSYDAGTIGLLLDAERYVHVDHGRATHVISLCASPEGVGEVGVVCVNVRPNASPGAAPGLVLTVSLEDELFDSDARSIQRLLSFCVDAVEPDLAAVGPRAWVRELRAGWATFTRAVHRDLLPAGAILVPAYGGSLIFAHAEEPASESTSARDAVAQVRAALDGRPQVPTQPADVADPPMPVNPALQPTFLTSSRAALAGTSLALDLPVGPALPFAPEAKSTLESPAKSERAAAPPSGTIDAVSLPVPPAAALPFGASAGPMAPGARRYVRPPAELSGTIDTMSLPLPPAAALPFAAGPQPAPATPPPNGPRYVRPPAELSGTMDVASLPIPNRPSLPFSAHDAAPAVPDLTLEQYAHLRAMLSVRGENDAETWRQFGVSSREVKEALQARFAAQFRSDPTAQARFVQLVQQRVAELRAR